MRTALDQPGPRGAFQRSVGAPSFQLVLDAQAVDDAVRRARRGPASRRFRDSFFVDVGAAAFRAREVGGLSVGVQRPARGERRRPSRPSQRMRSK